jgi:hypothetical protein
LTGSYYSRNILQAAIAAGADTLVLFVNHWPSKTWGEEYRVASAEALHAAITRLPARSEVLVMGDFNANYNEGEPPKRPSTRSKARAPSLASITHTLGSVRSAPGEPLDFIGSNPAQWETRSALYNLWLQLPPEQRRSAMYRGKAQTPDNMLLCAALLDSAGIGYADHSFGPFTFNGNLLIGEKIAGWQMQRIDGKAYHKGAGYSDHLPIMARFFFHRNPPPR